MIAEPAANTGAFATPKNNTKAAAPTTPEICKPSLFFALLTLASPLNTLINGNDNATTTIAGKINVNMFFSPLFPFYLALSKASFILSNGLPPPS